MRTFSNTRSATNKPPPRTTVAVASAADFPVSPSPDGIATAYGSPARPFDTRSRLLTAAEILFADRGIEAVSLREVTRASGAKNAIAVQYHFNDRAGVLQAILDKHAPDIESRRNAMLDTYEAEGNPDLRFLASAFILPLAAQLANNDGGPEFLQIYADLVNRPRPEWSVGESTVRNDSVQRWRKLLDPLLEPDATRLHRRFTAMLHTTVELGRRARSGPHTDDRLFVSYLIDVVAAILAAPVSPETRRLADERDTVRRRPKSKR